MAGVRAKRRSSGKYEGWFTNSDGKQQHFTGTQSYADTKRIAQRLEDEHRQIRLGYKPRSTLVRRDGSLTRKGSIWRGGQHKAAERDDPGDVIMPGSGASGLPGGSSTYASTW